jgi:hypothetical protein
MGSVERHELWEETQRTTDPRTAATAKRVSWGKVHFSDVKNEHEIDESYPKQLYIRKVDELATNHSEKNRTQKSESSPNVFQTTDNSQSKQDSFQTNGFFDIRKAYNLDEGETELHLDQVLEEIPGRYEVSRDGVNKRKQSTSARKYQVSAIIVPNDAPKVAQSGHKLKNALMRLAQDNGDQHNINKQLNSGSNVPVHIEKVHSKPRATAMIRSDPSNQPTPLSKPEEQRRSSESTTKANAEVIEGTVSATLQFVTISPSDRARTDAHRSAIAQNIAAPPRRGRPAACAAVQQAPPARAGAGCFGFVFRQRAPERPRPRVSG